MILLGRRPRRLYQVYAEDEFLHGAGLEELQEPVATEIGEARSRRLAGAAMLAGAVGTVGGVIAINIVMPASGPGRKAHRGSNPAARPYRQVLPAAVSLAAPRVSASSGLPLGAGHGHGAGRLPADRAPARSFQHAVRRAGVAPRGTPAIFARSVALARATVRAPAGPSRPERVEFGFER